MRISRPHWQALLAELEGARRQRHLVTYRALLERLQLPAPAMQTLAAPLEHLGARVALAERPLRSALVMSQSARRVPRTGLFVCAVRLVRFSGSVDGSVESSWHAGEVAQVFEFVYPEISGCA